MSALPHPGIKRHQLGWGKARWLNHKQLLNSL
jgi:hypothetical protein